MRSLLALVTSFAVFSAIACGSSDGRVTALRETVADYVEAFQDRDASRAYDFNHESYKDKCVTGATDDIFSTVDFFYGDTWDSAELRIDSVDIDGERATVAYDLYVDGWGRGFGAAKIFWLYEDGRWWRASDHPDPCGANDVFGPEFWKVSSLDEAAHRAGYTIATPSFVPDGFEQLGSITVRRNLRRGRSVTQAWGAAGGGAVEFVQEPGLGGLGGSEPFDIAGVPGERKFSPADPTIPRSPMLSLLWHDGDFTYRVTGFLGGSLTEDVVLKMAASIQID